MGRRRGGGSAWIYEKAAVFEEKLNVSVDPSVKDRRFNAEDLV